MASAVRITYDPEGDILYVTFGPPAHSTGHQVSDQILLRVHPESRQATGLTIRNYSLHARSRTPIPLPTGEGMEAAAQVVGLLRSWQVNRFLEIVDDPRGIHAIILQPDLAEAVAA